MNTKSFHLTKQTKYILIELLLGSCIIAIIAFVAINHLQNKMDKTYSAFAQLMTGTIAIQSAKFAEFPPAQKRQLLAQESSMLLDRYNDISFVEYKDKNNNIVYSSRDDFPIRDDETVFNVSSPIIKDGLILGYVIVGMTGKGLKTISSTTKKSLYGIFILAWLTFAVILIINIFLISKELTKIYDGVKQIATGKFGYKLESENMQELTEAFNDMSNILSKYEEQNIEQLTLERNKLEAVLMSIINGVIVCDNFDNVVLVNSSALKMLDIKEENFVNTKIQDYIDSHDQRCFLDKIEEFKDTPLNIIEQKPIEFNIEVGKSTIKAMISPMFSKQQDYVGYVIVLLDVTRETEVNKLKNTFISNVSHELRTPVTVLRTYIDTLCSNGSDFDEDTKNEFMKTIDTEAKRLHTMVNDILDFSRLESDNINLKKQYADIENIIKQNINSIKILASEKNINIDFKSEDEIPEIPINVESIDRVVRNLLSNAIKYSPDGKDVLVSVGLSDNKQFVKAIFKDNGMGIAKEHLDKIFDRFYRVENATHTIKGTGLGLHLVKMTVEKHHHGKITVTSTEGIGSTFTIFLPVTTDECELE